MKEHSLEGLVEESNKDFRKREENKGQKCGQRSQPEALTAGTASRRDHAEGKVL